MPAYSFVRVAALALVLLSGTASAQTIWYVDADATGASTGTSWADAFSDLQAALAAAASGDEVWVAEGTYVPGTTFSLPDDVGVYGGFAGAEATRDERDPETHETILSGDMGVGFPARHVVSAEGVTATLDGFTVRDGRGTDGAGVYVVEGAVTLRDLLVTRNGALRGGGAAFLGGTHVLERVRFSSNSASSGSNPSPYGGGLFASDAALTLRGIEFEYNTTGAYNYNSVGAAAYISNSTVSTEGCLFRYNFNYEGSAALHISGGTFASVGDVFFNNRGQLGSTNVGAYNGASVTIANARFYSGDVGVEVVSSAASIVNSIFVGQDRAALLTRSWSDAESRIDATNLTIFATVAGDAHRSGAVVNLKNVIVVDALAATETEGGEVRVTRALLPEDYSAGDDITVGTPSFVAPPQAGSDGEWGTDDDPPFDLGLQEGSQGIDAGDPSLLPPDVLDLDGDGDTSEPLPLDAAGEPRQRGTTVDLGAYESPYAVSTEPPPTEPLVGVGPNPTRHRVAFRLDAPAQIAVSIVVVDALGRRVLAPPARTVEASAGQPIEVSVRDLPTGVYAYRLTADDGSDVTTHEGRFTVVR